MSLAVRAGVSVGLAANVRGVRRRWTHRRGGVRRLLEAVAMRIGITAASTWSSETNHGRFANKQAVTQGLEGQLVDVGLAEQL